MHFDSRPAFVEARFVGELSEFKMAVELAIDAREEVKVESRGDAGRIVRRRGGVWRAA